MECLSEGTTVTENKAMISLHVYDQQSAGVHRAPVRSEGEERGCQNGQTGSGPRQHHRGEPKDAF